MRKCSSCLLPDAVPGSELDASGQCRLCREARSGPEGLTPTAPTEAELVHRRAVLDEALRNARGQGEYDVLICLSGGKDSLYLLYRAQVELGLRVLAFTTDVNLPDIAWNNILRTVKKLQVDHLVYRPQSDFYKKLFRYLLTHQEARGAVYTVSYVYAPLFEGDAIRIAMQKRIPVVLAGYSPGQPEPERMTFEFSRDLIAHSDWTPPHLKSCGAFSHDELSRFFDPTKLPPGTEVPRYFAPFHAWHYNQEEIMKKVVELGLVANTRSASPIFSNYPINWLLMFSDLKAFGFNPYAPEFSALIRNGKANLNQWKLMGPAVDWMIRNKALLGREVAIWLKELGLRESDLAITLPRGAYDPVIRSSA